MPASSFRSPGEVGQMAKGARASAAARAAREAARLTGEKMFDGDPCIGGHGSRRYVRNGLCAACVLSRGSAWVQANPERVKARRLARYAANPERTKASVAAWKRANPDKVNATNARRHAARLKRTVSWSSRSIERLAYWLARAVTQITGAKWHVDHIYPLQGETVSGLHVPMNLVVIPGRLNSVKRNHIDERQADGASLKNTLEDVRWLVRDYPAQRLELHKHENAILELLELSGSAKN